MDISIVVPFYNEQECVKELHSRISKVMKQLKRPYEILYVDDGSTDKTFEELLKIRKKDLKVRIIKFRKNFGQASGWDAGFKEAKGKIIITLDSDLQNDPADIPKLLAKLDSYDVVSGWRHKRKDNLMKRLFSYFSRFLRKRIIDDHIHDSGCSLKAYKRETIDGLDLHGEMHRYITELLALKGFKIGEVKVNHFPRTKGKSKYNLIRLPKGFLDLLVVAFWQKYSARPIHLFGGLGILMSFFGFLSGAYLVYTKFMFGEAISNRPLLLLAILMIVLGMQFVIFGLIADVLVKMYYSGDRRHYNIEKII